MVNFKNLTLTIPKELFNWLKEYKKQNYVSLSAIITDLIQEWRLRHEEKQN